MIVWYIPLSVWTHTYTNRSDIVSLFFLSCIEICRLAQLITLLNEFHARICRLEFAKYDMEFEVKKKDFEVHTRHTSSSKLNLSLSLILSLHPPSCCILFIMILWFIYFYFLYLAILNFLILHSFLFRKFTFLKKKCLSARILFSHYNRMSWHFFFCLCSVNHVIKYSHTRSLCFD